MDISLCRFPGVYRITVTDVTDPVDLPYGTTLPSACTFLSVKAAGVETINEKLCGYIVDSDEEEEAKANLELKREHLSDADRRRNLLLKKKCKDRRRTRYERTVDLAVEYLR